MEWELEWNETWSPQHPHVVFWEPRVSGNTISPSLAAREASSGAPCDSRRDSVPRVYRSDQATPQLARNRLWNVSFCGFSLPGEEWAPPNGGLWKDLQRKSSARLFRRVGLQSQYLYIHPPGHSPDPSAGLRGVIAATREPAADDVNFSGNGKRLLCATGFLSCPKRWEVLMWKRPGGNDVRLPSAPWERWHPGAAPGKLI